MAWYELIVLFFFLAALISLPLCLWFLEKPERDLRKKRLEEAVNFYHSAGYVFNHIASNISRYDYDHEIITACFSANLKLMEDK